jgi:hypothetical protein
MLTLSFFQFLLTAQIQSLSPAERGFVEWFPEFWVVRISMERTHILLFLF